MNFNLTNEQMEYKKEVETFGRNKLNDKDGICEFSNEMWKKVAELGLLGVVVSEEYGGMNEDYLTAAIIFETLGYSCNNNGFIFAVNNHIWVAQNLIYLYGSDYLKNKYLYDMVQGNKIGAFALTECDSGSDAYNINSVATKSESGYVLSGNKMFISNGTIADVFIVFAKEKNDKERTLAFVIEKTYKGVRVGKEIEKMGLDSCPISELVLDDCVVPEKNILGSIENGRFIMMAALEWERIFEFAPHVGAMKRLIEKCTQYSNTRKQFNREIGTFQAVSHKISDMKKNYELSKLMLYKIAWLKDQGKSAFTEAAIFKIFVSESYIRACQDAMQIYGAYGYTKEYQIERELRDAMACSVYSGTNEMLRNTIYQMLSIESEMI